MVLETNAQYVCTMSYSKDEFIEAAKRQENFRYQIWTYKDLRFSFVKEDEIPKEALSIVKKHGKVIEVSYAGKCKWLAPNEAPSESEAAKKALFYGLQSSVI